VGTEDAESWKLCGGCCGCCGCSCCGSCRSSVLAGACLCVVSPLPCSSPAERADSSMDTGRALHSREWGEEHAALSKCQGHAAGKLGRAKHGKSRRGQTQGPVACMQSHAWPCRGCDHQGRTLPSACPDTDAALL